MTGAVALAGVAWQEWQEWWPGWLFPENCPHCPQSTRKHGLHSSALSMGRRVFVWVRRNFTPDVALPDGCHADISNGLPCTELTICICLETALSVAFRADQGILTCSLDRVVSSHTLSNIIFVFYPTSGLLAWRTGCRYADTMDGSYDPRVPAHPPCCRSIVALFSGARSRPALKQSSKWKLRLSLWPSRSGLELNEVP